ncbi:MAG: phosphate ABC transporter permease PstC [Pseudomonadota bacterium]
MTAVPLEGSRRFRLGDASFKALLWLAALVVLITLGAILFKLFQGGQIAFHRFGWAFLWSGDWDPVRDLYGAAAPVIGTLASSLFAVAIAWPIGFGIAYFLTETCPKPLRAPLGVAVELLAAVPSIVYGMWGLFVLAPLIADPVSPWITANAWMLWIFMIVLGFLVISSLFLSVFGRGIFGMALVAVLAAGAGWGIYYFVTAKSDLPPVPSLDNPLWWWFQGTAIGGVGLFTAAIVLAIMILPFIAATSRDVLQTTPQLLKDGGYAMGATRWEVLTGIVIPAVRGSLFGAVFLGLGRALGETMAVTFVIGNANRPPDSFFAPTASIASIVANTFPETEPDTLKQGALLALGFMLFVVSFIVLAIARLMLRQGRMAG